MLCTDDDDEDVVLMMGSLDYLNVERVSERERARAVERSGNIFVHCSFCSRRRYLRGVPDSGGEDTKGIYGSVGSLGCCVGSLRHSTQYTEVLCYVCLVCCAYVMIYTYIFTHVCIRVLCIYCVTHEL